MLLDLIANAEPSVAFEILERTASTPRVQQAVQLSLAPAFLLVGISGIMNVMVGRLTWVAGRIERLCDLPEERWQATHAFELEWLRQRRRLARHAIKFSTGAAVVISIVIAMLFVSAYIEQRIGTIVAILWVLTIGLLITGLVQFLRETLLAAKGPKEG